jgi:hypothetical protein
LAIGSDVVPSSCVAASTRYRGSHRCGVTPVAALKAFVKYCRDKP